MFVVPSQISSKTETSADSTHKVLDAVMLRSRKAYYASKRCLDIVLALIMLLLSLPFWLLIAAVIKCDSRGPVLFVNRAVGQHGKEFLLYKFRSMRSPARPDLETTDVVKNALERKPTTYKNGKPIYKTALANDDRITRVGRILRRISLDELPQLWNILRGDLSFVGPRPSLPDEVALYEEWQKQRLLVPQGLTGLYQVTARNRVPIDEMIRIDLDYIRRRSLWLDIKILCKTPFAMFSGL
jgi:lipopolysaccharide/colanic/teichoic acid biosynthesis glycosyltransferase